MSKTPSKTSTPPAQGQQTRFVELMTELFQLDEAALVGCDRLEAIESVFALQFGRN